MLIKFAHKRHLVTYAFRNSYNIFLQTICTEYYCLQRATAPSNKLKMRYIFSGKMHPKQVNSKKNFLCGMFLVAKCTQNWLILKKTNFLFVGVFSLILLACKACQSHFFVNCGFSSTLSSMMLLYCHKLRKKGPCKLHQIRTRRCVLSEESDSALCIERGV